MSKPQGLRFSFSFAEAEALYQAAYFGSGMPRGDDPLSTACRELRLALSTVDRKPRERS